MTEPWPKFLNKMTPLEHVQFLLRTNQCSCDTTKYDHESYCQVPALKRAEQELVDLRRTIDSMMRECGSEPNSRYARNACIIGAAALALKETPHE